MKIYLAGPMAGHPGFNFPAFHEAAERLRADGHEVFNPAERDLEKHRAEIFSENKTGDVAESEKHGFSLREAMRDDTSAICSSDAIALLPGWEFSGGARAEWALAVCLRLERIYL